MNLFYTLRLGGSTLGAGWITLEPPGSDTGSYWPERCPHISGLCGIIQNKTNPSSPSPCSVFLFSIWLWALLPCCLTILMWLHADLPICSVAFLQNIFHRLGWMEEIGRLFMEDTPCDTASHYCLRVLLIPQPSRVILYSEATSEAFFSCKYSFIPWTCESICFSKAHFFQTIM